MIILILCCLLSLTPLFKIFATDVGFPITTLMHELLRLICTPPKPTFLTKVKNSTPTPLGLRVNISAWHLASYVSPKCSTPPYFVPQHPAVLNRWRECLNVWYQKKGKIAVLTGSSLICRQSYWSSCHSFRVRRRFRQRISADTSPEKASCFF